MFSFTKLEIQKRGTGLWKMEYENNWKYDNNGNMRKGISGILQIMGGNFQKRKRKFTLIFDVISRRSKAAKEEKKKKERNEH